MSYMKLASKESVIAVAQELSIVNSLQRYNSGIIGLRRLASSALSEAIAAEDIDKVKRVLSCGVEVSEAHIADAIMGSIAVTEEGWYIADTDSAESPIQSD
ncbi:MAG: hypothetical protein JXR97_13535 [Planctomycetes bacterium]|nr:hypothetical protein [Planctomycetota bacterium]